ncbi:hypothetical protein [Lentisalinibacter salinarum]|uniref:hypothetical protein n=1 Tax=Lentisalinibacter salinarum TaxID=2992239 RepID=UPI0038698757
MSEQAVKAPDWAGRMEPGHWFRISGDEPDLGLPPTPAGTRYLEDGDPARDPLLNPPLDVKERIRRALGRDWIAPWRGRMGFCAITEAWNSAIFATRFGESGAMVIFGGGHTTYFGSDVHAFDVASRGWNRLTTGFVTGNPEDYGEGAVYETSTYPDGSPLPPHTYDYVQYDPAGNDYLLLKGQTELGPRVKATPIPHLFNLDSLTWRHGPRHPSAILNSGGFTTWDPKRRILWGHSGDDGGGNAFVGYSPDDENTDGTTGRWRDFHPNKFPGEANHNAMTYEPMMDKLAVALHCRDRLELIDPDEPARPASAVASQGERPRIRQFAGLEYSPRLEALVYYSPLDGPTLHSIALDDSAEWHVVNRNARLDPIADAADRSRHPVNLAHCFGRFRIASFREFDMAILVRHIDTPVYAMRLPDYRGSLGD